MRVSSPSSNSRITPVAGILAGAVISALLVAIIVSITGGFRFDAGALRVSAHDPWDAALIAAIAATFGLVAVRAPFTAALAQVAPLIDRRSPALAAVLAAATFGMGVAFGTYSAAGADAAGYVSQATLIADGRIVRDEPLAREVGWPEATWKFSPLGYRPGRTEGELAPTYPPGLPLLMAGAIVALGPFAAYLLVPAMGAAGVALTYLIGTRLHSRLAGLTAAALLSTSPIFLFQLVQPMSDVPALMWWTLAMFFAVATSRAAPFGAGIASGVAVLIRPNLAPVAMSMALIIAIAARERRARAVLLFGCGLAPAVLGLLGVQARLYGSPFRSGYGPLDEVFTTSVIALNASRYAMRLIRSEYPALLLAAFAALAAVISVRWGRPRVHVQQNASTVMLLAPTAVSCGVVACYLPYGEFTEWQYLRFLLPAFPPVLVVVGAMFVRGLDAFPATTRGLVLLALIIGACGLNLKAAANEQAFRLRSYESRYRSIGLYVSAAYPANVVFVASQESASLLHYADRAVLRWDIADDLDRDVATLERLGRKPILVVEDWEAPRLSTRFPSSRLAQADWLPRARFMGTTIVSVLDPGDLDAPLARPPDVLRDE